MSEEVRLEELTEQPEEAIEEVVDIVEEDSAVEVQEEVEYSDTEKEAIKQGWKPPSEFADDGKEAVSADEFLRRGPLFEKIKELKQASRRETQKLQEQVAKLNKQMLAERERGYTQAIADLEAKRREAIEMGDVDAFNSIDGEYTRLRDELNSAKKESEAAYMAEEPDIPEEAVKFQEANADWFNSNTPENNQMVNQAITIDQYLAESKPYLSTEQRLKAVQDEIKGLYPHRFKNPKRKQPVKVETASTASAPSKSDSGVKIKYQDLDDRQKQACERFIALDSSLTVNDYLKSVEEGLRIRNQL